MTQQEHSIDQLMPINYARLLASELRLREAELSTLLAGTSITVDDLKGGTGTLTIADNFTVLNNGLELSGDPTIGLRLGKLLHISTHGQMGVAAFTSKNLEEAIASLCNYIRIRAPFLYIDQDKRDDILILTIRSTLDADTTISTLLTELVCLLIQQLVEFILTRNLTEGLIKFDYPEPSYVEKYIEDFHSRFEFNSENVQFCIPCSVLDTPCPTADKDAYDLAIKLCKSKLEQLQGDISIKAQVKRILFSKPSGSISQEDVAHQLCITTRTLIRRLKQENCNYRDLHEDAMAELARSYLNNNRMSVEAVAAILGYSDTANFRRAFKRWTKLTPQQYRSTI
jgi:AraC-like DNA-binding protein